MKAGPIPYSIVRAMQFFEFIGRIADSAAEGDTIRLSPAGGLGTTFDRGQAARSPCAGRSPAAPDRPDRIAGPQLLAGRSMGA